MWPVLLYVLPLAFWPLGLLFAKRSPRRLKVLRFGFFLYVAVQFLAFAYVWLAFKTSQDWLISLIFPQMVAMLAIIGNLAAVLTFRDAACVE